jgi:hypothetical protein
MKLEHEQWQGRLRFYKDELSHFHNHLDRLAYSGKSKDVLPKLNHFQSLFRDKEGDLNQIRTDFNKHESLIQSMNEGGLAEPDEGIRKVHRVQRDKLEQFERLFHDLRREFNVFLNDVSEYKAP